MYDLTLHWHNTRSLSRHNKQQGFDKKVGEIRNRLTKGVLSVKATKKVCCSCVKVLRYAYYTVIKTNYELTKYVLQSTNWAKVQRNRQVTE